MHIAQLDAGLVSPVLEPIRLRNVIERIGAEFSFDADHRGLRFNFTCVDCFVMTDHALFETIVRNLVSNAFKFTKTGGVHLAARARGNKAVVEIYDTGPGIEQQRLKKIFYEFERSTEQAHGTNEGLGLGLSIVERYAALIDARVTIISVVGRGSRFSVEVPKLEKKSPGLAKPEIAGAACSIANVNIMLVDDDNKSLNALRTVLTDRGANVTGFAVGRDALRAVDAGLAVDVAIVDYDLGDENSGIDLIWRWRRDGRNFNAMILTGRTDSRTLSELADSSVPWMTKPATADSIALAVERMSRPSQKSIQPSASR